MSVRHIALFASVVAVGSCVSLPDVAVSADGAVTDLPVSTDQRADLPDLGPDAPTCGPAAEASTVALYRFDGEGDTLVEALGDAYIFGRIVGSGVTRVAGADGCGTALSFPGSPDGGLPEAVGGNAEIPASAAWKLERGSIVFDVRFDAPPQADRSIEGIIARDASGRNFPGHLLVYRSCRGAIIVRRQQDPDTEVHACSAPIDDSAWHRVIVNFGDGGSQLYVDGVLADRADSVYRSQSGQCKASAGNPCGGQTTIGIDGNDNPWVLGASGHESEDGKATPATWPMAGAIDNLIINNAPVTP